MLMRHGVDYMPVGEDFCYDDPNFHLSQMIDDEDLDDDEEGLEEGQFNLYQDEEEENLINGGNSGFASNSDP